MEAARRVVPVSTGLKAVVKSIPAVAVAVKVLKRAEVALLEDDMAAGRRERAGRGEGERRRERDKEPSRKGKGTG